MRVEFYNVGASSAQNVDVPLFRIATFLITDWIPTRPGALSAGFAPLLERVLQRDGQGRWTTSGEVTSFERQWRQVTSWMMGVAFARHTVEQLGYPYVAPVSAFSGGLSGSATATPKWRDFYDRLESRIGKPEPPLSRLEPDYIVGRFEPATGSGVIAFVESKASRGAETLARKPPQPWYNQARNAEFRFRGRVIRPERTLVVATRVNPWAKRERTRRIVVRAWNSAVKAETPRWEVMRELVVVHYHTLLESLGLTAFGEIIRSTVAERFRTERRGIVVETARRDLEPHRIGRTAATVQLRRGAEPFQLGGDRLWVGVDAGITDALAELLDQDAEQALKRFVDRRGQSTRGQREKQEEQVMTRGDGVIAFTERR
jgi:hypothetical protein